MVKTQKSKKPLLITLSVTLGLAVVFAALYGICYLIADSLIYHYVDLSGTTRYYSTYDSGGTAGEGLKYPFFGNPLMVSEETGSTYHLVLGAGEKLVPVYAAINEPIVLWIEYMKTRYKNNAVVDYNVEMDNEYITVNFTGKIKESGEEKSVEQKFVSRIFEASSENLPVWVNNEEISDDFGEYLAYIKGDAEAPEWLENWKAA